MNKRKVTSPTNFQLIILWVSLRHLIFICGEVWVSGQSIGLDILCNSRHQGCSPATGVKNCEEQYAAPAGIERSKNSACHFSTAMWFYYLTAKVSMSNDSQHTWKMTVLEHLPRKEARKASDTFFCFTLAMRHSQQFLGERKRVESAW